MCMPATAPPPQLSWELAPLFPAQGEWTEGDYLALAPDRRVELSDARVEVLPVVTQGHQDASLCFYRALYAFADANGLGKTTVAPMRVRLWPGKIREPDVVFMLAENAHKVGDRYWDGADLAVEVVSEDDPERDLQTKRNEYAQAGIREYWIIDPRDKTVQLLTLEPGAAAFTLVGRYGLGQTAASKLLDGFAVDLSALFAGAYFTRT